MIQRDNSNIIISVKDIYKSYGKEQNKVEALKEVSLDVYKGELLVIIGSSGSGKSTLLNMIGGIDKPDSGSIFSNGEDICKYNDKKLTSYRKNSVGFVFQSFNLINEITAKENVALTANTLRNPNIVDETLKKVNLYDKRNKYPSQLSGGEQQRVSIARALANTPDILLCDEPTGALDYENGKQILRELEKLSRQDGKTVIIVTHTREISKMADRVVTIKNGKIIDETKIIEPISADKIDW